jgi:tRNA pseudouridine13 synthase
MPNYETRIMNSKYDSSSFAYAFGRPEVTGQLRASPEDFRVDEISSFTPDGEGEHVFLHLQKRETNTDWLAGLIARLAGVKRSDVSYAGMKDRNAITTQWFSVSLCGRDEPDWRQLEGEHVTLLQVTRNRKKLRRGVLAGNRFEIVIRDLVGPLETLVPRLEVIAASGVPNYFGEQRFGMDGGNLEHAEHLLSGEKMKCPRHQRGIYLSAARSWLFNQLLSRRVSDGSWNQILPGELVMLDGSHSVFLAEQPDEDLLRRIAEFDIHPTGPLPGKGAGRVQADCAALEQEVLAPYDSWLQGLVRAGVEAQRRSLRLPVRELEWDHLDSTSLHLKFYLPAGAYATSVVREICRCT